MKVFEIKLGNAILERGERGQSPVAEGVSQKHEVADNTIRYHIRHSNILRRMPNSFYHVATPPPGRVPNQAPCLFVKPTQHSAELT